jgi:hypothetical protein
VIRNVIVPGAVLIACCAGVIGFFLWKVYSPHWHTFTTIQQQDYPSDAAAQRRLATCYTTGCPSIPSDPAFACAWRQVIAAEHKPTPPADVTAMQSVCSRLSTFDRTFVRSVAADIRSHLSEDKPRGDTIVPQRETQDHPTGAADRNG